MDWQTLNGIIVIEQKLFSHRSVTAGIEQIFCLFWGTICLCLGSMTLESRQ